MVQIINLFMCFRKTALLFEFISHLTRQYSVLLVCVSETVFIRHAHSS